jgi:hypothetical protein
MNYSNVSKGHRVPLNHLLRKEQSMETNDSSALAGSNEASIEAIKDSYHTMVIEYRHVWGCD